MAKKGDFKLDDNEAEVLAIRVLEGGNLAEAAKDHNISASSAYAYARRYVEALPGYRDLLFHPELMRLSAMTRLRKLYELLNNG